MAVWLQQADNGVIKFPRDGCFHNLVPHEMYLLKTRSREEDSVVSIDLTVSPPIARRDTAVTHQIPPATGIISDINSDITDFNSIVMYDSIQ